MLWTRLESSKIIWMQDIQDIQDISKFRGMLARYFEFPRCALHDAWVHAQRAAEFARGARNIA